MTRPAGTPPAGRDPVLDELEHALQEGRVSPAQVQAVMRASGAARTSGRAGAVQVLVALGLAVALLGVVIVYARAFVDMPDGAQVASPFLFPLAAAAALVLVVRRHRPHWEREVSAFVLAASFGGAWAAAAAGLEDVPLDVWGLIGAALLTALGAGLLLWLRPTLYAAVLSVMVGAVGAANFAAAVLGADRAEQFRWVEFALAAVALGVALALRRRDPAVAALAGAGAVVLVCLGSAMSIAQMDSIDLPLTVWHEVLTITAAAAMVAAAGTGQPVLWLAAAGSTIVWFMFTIPVVGGDPAAGVVVVLAGLALAAVGVLAARWRGRRGRRRGAGPTAGG